jgi:membrane-bound metal-dependent hydrolase YbcI (DUF457 family)
MDFITHSLVGAGVARLAAPKRSFVQQLSLAGVAASLLQDADFWLYNIDPNYYGRYHRVASHSVWALALIALAAATLAWAIARKPRARRFGWFVSDNLPGSAEVPRARWVAFAGVALAAAYLHVAMDAITGFGNVLPLWPWSTWDASLAAVTSFDWIIFAGTLGWHVVLRTGKWTRRQEWIVSGAYALAIIVYVGLRAAYGEPTVW